jgi:hypothetical protein
MSPWTGQRGGEARGSMRDQQRATAFIWEFGLHIGQLFMHGSCNAVMDCGCSSGCTVIAASVGVLLRSARGKGRGGYALSFLLSPSTSSSVSLSHLAPIIPIPSSSAPTASTRLTFGLCLVCCCATLLARNDRICMMNAQRWLVRLPWVPKPLARPSLHESAAGSSKSRSPGYAIHHHLP